MTELYLITGFLGAGKTTFLKERLNQTHSKVGVLMNEFGKVSIDGMTIQNDSISLLELTNGSIFCSCLKENFIQGLIQLLSCGLEELYIEASGLSDPSDMGKVLSIVDKSVDPNTYLFKGTICLVDGVYLKKELKTMVSVERQIKHSQHILINKIDLISAEELTELTMLIRSINSKAYITPIVHGKIDWSSLTMASDPIEDEETTNTVDSRPRSLTLHFIQPLDREKLMVFLSSITSHFFRIKGYLILEGKLFKIDAVNDLIEIREYEHVLTEKGSDNLNELVFLSSKGLESISILAQAADNYIAGCYKLSM